MYSLSSIKDKILSQTSQEDIYRHYLGISEFPKNMRVSNPFTDKDKNPSFHFYPDGEVLKYKGHNESSRNGDVWQFVADLKQMDCKTDFVKVCNIIAKDMNIPLEVNENLTKTSNNQQKKALQTHNDSISKPISTPRTLRVTKREFTDLDLAYWEKLGVAKPILEKYNLHSISDYCWSEKKPIYTKKESVAFAIELDEQTKIYIPNQPEVGIKKNSLPAFKSGIFGLEQLGAEKKESIVICAGEKDTIVANSRGFNAITFGSESGHPKAEQIECLQKLCTHLFVCYDNDEAGEKGRNALVKRFPTIIPLQLPKSTIEKYDITDYFQEHTAGDFQKIIDLALKNKKEIGAVDTKTEKWTKFHEIEQYLNEKYDFRFNTIASDIEISIKNKNEWSTCNEDSIWLELQKKSIAIGVNQLKSILKSEFVKEHNPIVSYFEQLPKWDKKTDFITMYSEYIRLNVNEDREQFEYHFKKWCVRAVKCATIDGYFNKQAFVLSDNAIGQNIGKTSYIKNLCPKILEDYIQTDLPRDSKDAKIALAKNFLINLDELAYLSKNDVNSLKSLFSESKIKLRLPYGSKDSIVQRVSSFIGSTNNITFLNDETGSVRWLCFLIDSIDFSYRDNFNVDNLWSQAYTLANDLNFNETLTKDDIIKNEIRNEKYQIPTAEKELINKFFEKPDSKEKVEYFTSTDILNEISKHTLIRLSSVLVGKAMTSLKFNRVKHNQIYCYEVCQRYLDTNQQ